MAEDNSQKGVTDCYVFKSRLQEYAQKVGVPTPVYQTVKEGPSHEPVFKSTVIVNDVRYDSLAGFFNRKAAEQSAAEVALAEIEKSGKMTECLPTVHETGLCKNLLQEYAQKMNYAIPSYQCNKQASGKLPFSCTVEIGGIQYIGAAARTKKEAEIKAARTALLAINSTSWGYGINGVSQYTVLPGKKKGKESAAPTEAVKNVKPRRAEFKKKWPKRKFPRNKARWLKPDNNDLGTDGDGPGAEAANGEVPAVVNGSNFGENNEPNPCPTVNGEFPGGSTAVLAEVPPSAEEPGAIPFTVSSDHHIREDGSVHHSEDGVLTSLIRLGGGDNPQW